jgi:hypothetical protein
MVWTSVVRTNSPHEVHTDVREDVAMISSCLPIDERTTEVEISGGNSAEAASRSLNPDSRKLMAERKAVETAVEVGLRLLHRGRSAVSTAGVGLRLLPRGRSGHTENEEIEELKLSLTAVTVGCLVTVGN